jgi:DNA adenine methylase
MLSTLPSAPEALPDDPMSAIAPIRPPAPYIGGKRMLAKRLVERINAVPHTLYAEPFVGMGGIFFRRDQRPKCEVINDWSDDVATFFRILQRHYVPFMDMLRWQITSRAGFDRLRRQDPSTLTDLERAARFLYLQRLAFGGKVASRNFGVDTTMGARFDVAKIGPLLEAAHERLTGVVIEHLPWSDFITRYDRPGTLFYLDPPYYGCEKDYGATLFDRPQFTAMAAQLRTLKGRFILSLNDHPEVRRIFEGFTITPVPVRYTVGGMAQSKIAGEVIIST